MEFTKSLVKGKLIKRYKRFFTDVKLGKEIVTAHCPNTGSMKGLLDVMKFICFLIMIQKGNLNMDWRLLNLEKI